jgi:hypothetical protein
VVYLTVPEIDMEPTGFDTVIFTFVRPRHVFRRVLGAIVARWPGSLVDDLDDSEAAPCACSSAGDDSLPSEAGVLLFLRDSMMAWHLRDYGYTPMPDGDGPFALWSRKRAGVEFRLRGLEEARVTDDPRRVGQIDPYPAWLCSPVVYEMTAVTPANPEDHPFSGWACRIVKQACSEMPS